MDGMKDGRGLPTQRTNDDVLGSGSGLAISSVGPQLSPSSKSRVNGLHGFYQIRHMIKTKMLF